MPKTTTVTIDCDAGRLVTKLRLIAKHAAELADELEAVDEQEA